jgi:hypothetical protein
MPVKVSWALATAAAHVWMDAFCSAVKVAPAVAVASVVRTLAAVAGFGVEAMAMKAVWKTGSELSDLQA